MEGRGDVEGTAGRCRGWSMLNQYWPLVHHSGSYLFLPCRYPVSQSPSAHSIKLYHWFFFFRNRVRVFLGIICNLLLK